MAFFGGFSPFHTSTFGSPWGAPATLAPFGSLQVHAPFGQTFAPFGTTPAFGTPIGVADATASNTVAPYTPGQDVGAKLTYFAGRGRAEGIRYALALARVPWEEEYLTSTQQWEDLKASGKLPFDQVPLLEFKGGHLVQSGATVRAIGRHAGLYGNTPAECYRVDSILEAANDLVEPIIKLPFGAGRTPEALESALAGFTKKIAIFERLFVHHEETGRPWVFLCRPTPTVADSQLAMAIRWAIDELGEQALQVVQAAPRVARFLTNFEQLPQIQAYLQGPQRPPLADDEYVTTVRTVLNF